MALLLNCQWFDSSTQMTNSEWALDITSRQSE
jgi:hypothetical protein